MTAGPRFAQSPPELMWVRVIAERGGAYAGTVLNRPHGLTTVREGSEILFICRPGCEHPFRTSEKYLAERKDWEIVPCNQCGFAELFDAPSDLIRRVFPDLPPGQAPQMMTAFCPICRGAQVVCQKGLELDGSADTGVNADSGTKTRPPKAWWQFWK